MRQLSPGNSRRIETPAPMEHKKLEEILSVNVLDLFFLESNKQVYLFMSLNKQL